MLNKLNSKLISLMVVMVPFFLIYANMFTLSDFTIESKISIISSVISAWFETLIIGAAIYVAAKAIKAKKDKKDTDYIIAKAYFMFNPITECFIFFFLGLITILAISYPFMNMLHIDYIVELKAVDSVKILSMFICCLSIREFSNYKLQSLPNKGFSAQGNLDIDSL